MMMTHDTALVAHTHGMKPACRAVGTPKTKTNLAVEHLLTARKDRENLPLHVLKRAVPLMDVDPWTFKAAWL